MKQAQQIASPNTLTNSTYFGPLRIKKVVGATTTRYLYSGSKPIAEYVNGSTTPSKEYIYAGSTLLATIAGTSTTYHHPDHLSNRAETDTTGAVVRSAGHFPFGESWYENSSDPMKFTSYIRDSSTGESGLDYALFRQYSSGQGRFMSADLMARSIHLPQSLNRYNYTGSNPTNMIDPLGLTWVDFTQRFCTNTSQDGKASGEHCVWETSWVWIEDSPGGGPIIPSNAGGQRRNCAGKTMQIAPNVRVSSDKNGAVNGIGVRLTGNQSTVLSGPDSPMVNVPADTWAGATLNSTGAMTMGFSNPVFVKPGGALALGGAYISTATFAGGSFTQVNGALAFGAVPLGSKTGSSSPLQSLFNADSQLVNLANMLQQMLNLARSLLSCNDL
jgi:RHS repeat-associated protein